MTRVAVYNCGYHNPLPLTINQSLIKVYSDLDSFLSDPSSAKLAILEINYLNTESTSEKLKRLIGCTQVVIRSIEFNWRILNIIKEYDLPNFVFVLNGILNFNLKHATVDQEYHWLTVTSHPYRDVWVDYLQKNLYPYDKKPFMFDVLYGQYRLHRTFVKEKLLTVTEPNWYYEAPFFVPPERGNKNWNNLNFELTDLWEDEMEIDSKYNYLCRYRGREMLISQVLPIKIYNKTAYSIVMETGADNRYSFFTEKIAKPILGRRLFVVISGQHYLRNLRQLGFKTFDEIIDESYDSIQDDKTRWTKAMEQTEWLCQQPQEKILSQIAPIVIHNYAVLGSLRHLLIDQCAEVFLIQNGCASRG
jgi:hypothetical protein